MRKTNPFGFADHACYGGDGAHLIVGQRPDGSYVHISDVESGLACNCICPACGKPLEARKGDVRVHHFGHHRDNAGGCGSPGQTNAHIWAKDVLERLKMIMLPAIEARAAGQTLKTRRETTFTFDSVRLERRLGETIPDVILLAGHRQVVVEIYVTHRCDEEKRRKIRASEIPTLEVDLSAYRTSTDIDAIEKALLATGPREWIFNRHVETARARLRSTIERDKQAKIARRQRDARAILAMEGVAALPMSQHLSADTARVRVYGRSHYVGLDVGRVLGFLTSTSAWQAALFSRMVLERGSTFTPAQALETIRDCIDRRFHQPVSAELAREIEAIDGEVSLPDAAVRLYLERLVRYGVLVEDSAGYSVSASERQASAQRRSEIERQNDVISRLDAIVQHLPEGERNFDANAWINSALPGFQMSLMELFKADGITWLSFERALTEVEKMVRGGMPAANMLGLPLDKEFERAKARKLADDQRKSELGAKARADALIRRAHDELADRAGAWLNYTAPGETLSFAEMARASAAGKDVAALALSNYRDDLARQREAERADQARQKRLDEEAHGWREKLAKLVAAQGLSAKRVESFLRGPRHDRFAPCVHECCRDEASFKACKRLFEAALRDLRRIDEIVAC